MSFGEICYVGFQAVLDETVDTVLCLRPFILSQADVLFGDCEAAVELEPEEIFQLPGGQGAVLGQQMKGRFLVFREDFLDQVGA